MSLPRLTLALVAAGFMAAQPGHAQITEPDIKLGIGKHALDDTTAITTRKAKPAAFDSFNDRLDFIHDNLHYSMQQHVISLDTMATKEGEAVPTPPTRLRLSPYVTFKQDEDIEFEFEPDLEVEVDLPNLERRWKIFIETSSSDLLPGVDPTEDESSGQVGLRRERRYFRSDAGVKFRWPPEVFARVEWVPEWSVEHTVVRPRQRIFWESEDGFGSLTSLTIHRWFGRNKDMFWQTVSAARYTTETTDGTELEQTIKLGLVRQALESKWNWKRVLKSTDIARGHGLRYSVFGNVDAGEGRLERHRFNYTFRCPLYKYWIYLEVSPGIEARAEDDWDVVPMLTVGIDMLFWGTYER